MIPVDYLRPLALFQGVDELTLQKLAAGMVARSVKSQEAVVKQGDTSSDLVFLLKGRLQVVDSLESGREVGLSFIQEGEFLGELSVVDGQPRSASVIALVDSVVAALPRALALEFFYKHPLGSERMIQRLVAKFRRASEIQSLSLSGKASERLVHVLTSIAQPQGDGSMFIERLPTQHQMAVMANVARETVARTLSQLKKEGAIEPGPNRQGLVFKVKLKRAS